MLRNLLRVGLVPVVATILGGCSGNESTSPLVPSAPEPSESQNEWSQTQPIDSSQVLATLDLPGGGRVIFARLGGAMAVTGFARTKEAEALLEKTCGQSPIEVYQSLSKGLAPPTALAEAWNEVSASIASGQSVFVGPGDRLVPTKDEAEAPGGPEKMSGSAFQSAYCGWSGYDWTWCLKDRTGTADYQKSSASYSSSHVNSVSGNFRVRIMYNYFGWHEDTEWLNTGDLVYGYTSTWPDMTHRVVIDNASGNDWHWAWRGDL